MAASNAEGEVVGVNHQTEINAKLKKLLLSVNEANVWLACQLWAGLNGEYNEEVARLLQEDILLCIIFRFKKEYIASVKNLGFIKFPYLTLWEVSGRVSRNIYAVNHQNHLDLTTNLSAYPSEMLE